MKTIFEMMIGVKVPCDYAWDDEGIVRIGVGRNIAAYAGGDFKGKCVIFLHGNGETAVSEKYLFDQLNARGGSVVSPDYRSYGLTSGTFSERGCFEVAHAAYDWLLNEKGAIPADIIPLAQSSPFHMASGCLRGLRRRKRNSCVSSMASTTTSSS